MNTIGYAAAKKAASLTSRLRTAKSWPERGVYVGSKHAVSITNLPSQIVGPGPVETGMFNRFAQTKENKANFLDAQVPNKRIGTPEEIANAIVFIGSDKASYIIGASLAVDGGWSPTEVSNSHRNRLYY